MKETFRTIHLHKRSTVNRKLFTVNRKLYTAPLLRLALIAALPLLVLTACTLRGDRRAIYNSVLTRAQQQNVSFDSITNVDSIQLAADYFDRHGSANDRMRAHYLLGCAYRDMGDAPRALECYQNAAERADTLSVDCDYGLLCKIHSQMASLFHYQELYQEELKEQNIAIHYAWQAKDTLAALNVLGRKASMFYMMDEKDSTLSVTNKIYDLYNDFGDSLSANTALAPAIYVYLSREQYEKAKPLLYKYENCSHLKGRKDFKNPDFYLLYYYKGLYCLGNSQTDSAEEYFRKLISHGKTPDNRLFGQRGLVCLYKQLHKKDSIIKYADLSYDMKDSLFKSLSSASIQRMQSVFDYSNYKRKASEEAQKSNLLKIRLITLSVILFVSFLIFGLFSYFIHARTRQRVKDIASEYAINMLSYSSLKKELKMMCLQKNKADNRIDYLEKEIANLQNSIRNMQSDKQSPEEWNIDDALFDNPVVQKFHVKAASGKIITDSDWADLRETVSQFMPNFIKTICDFGYPLSLKQTNTCILIKLRFSPSELCNILKMSPSAVSNMRRRLNQELFKEKGTASEFDDRIRLIPC